MPDLRTWMNLILLFLMVAAFYTIIRNWKRLRR